MPHGWRSAGPSNASPSSWTSADPTSARQPIIDAVVDRSLIDWQALLRRSSDERWHASVEALRALDAMRPRSAQTPSGQQPPAHVARVVILIAIAALHLASALASIGTAWARGVALPVGPALMVAAFLSAAVMLAPSARRDSRAFMLLGVFALSGAAFARAVLDGVPWTWLRESLLFRGIFPEVFAACALWEFAIRFPQVHRFTRVDRFARKAAGAAWLVAAALCLANLLAAHGVLERVLSRVERNDPDNWFWHLFVLTALPAMGVILLRASGAPHTERAKVARFALAIAGGAGPLLLSGLARMLSPSVDTWMREGHGLLRVMVDIAIKGGLVAMPVLATLVLVLERPSQLRAIAPGPLRWWAARLTRPGVWLSSRGWRGAHRRALRSAIERLRLARDTREIAAVLQEELARAVPAATARVVDPASLPDGTSLVEILQESEEPVELTRGREPFTILLPQDREWLMKRSVRLAAPIPTRDGSIAAIVLVGGDHDVPLRQRERWMVAALTAVAATAWSAAAGATGDDGASVAQECGTCGAVVPDENARCCASPDLRLAALPAAVNGRFTVVRRLGAGGMGIVYLGRDERLGRDVAMKTLPHLRGRAVALLKDEAHMMASLVHPHIATIYGLEIWRDTPVLVVEFCAGGTVADRIREGPLSLRQVLSIGIQIADALEALHQRGLIHRDVKPANIGLTASGTVKLLDFGLVTSDDTPAGTPAYMPPEVREGGTASVALDLWGLAMTLREAADDDASASLAAFFRRALALDPARRFHSSAEVASALREITGPR